MPDILFWEIVAVLSWKLKQPNQTQPRLSDRLDFTRLKLVQGKKEEEIKREAALKAKEATTGKTLRGKENDADITAAFDAADDEDVVF